MQNKANRAGAGWMLIVGQRTSWQRTRALLPCENKANRIAGILPAIQGRDATDTKVSDRAKQSQFVSGIAALDRVQGDMIESRVT